eukprot:3529283-Pleurochrysis_carterae.AAC.2
MLLLMMRRRVMRDLQRERKDAAAAREAAASSRADSQALAEGGAATGVGVAGRGRRADSSASGNSAARSLECFEDSAHMLDLVRRASAGLELLE